MTAPKDSAKLKCAQQDNTGPNTPPSWGEGVIHNLDTPSFRTGQATKTEIHVHRERVKYPK